MLGSLFKKKSASADEVKLVSDQLSQLFSVYDADPTLVKQYKHDRDDELKKTISEGLSSESGIETKWIKSVVDEERRRLKAKEDSTLQAKLALIDRIKSIEGNISVINDILANNRPSLDDTGEVISLRDGATKNLSKLKEVLADLKIQLNGWTK